MLRLIVRLRKSGRKISHEVLELCCFEWFQNSNIKKAPFDYRFRAVLFQDGSKTCVRFQGVVP